MAHAQLGAPARREAREEHPPLVGLAVPVGVAQEQHIRGARDDQPTPPGHDAVGEREAPGELRPAIHAPVAVGILEQRDPADRGLARRRTRGIAAVLGDVQPAALVERHGHRAGDERLGRDQFQAQAGLHLKGKRRLLGCERSAQRRTRWEWASSGRRAAARAQGLPATTRPAPSSRRRVTSTRIVCNSIMNASPSPDPRHKDSAASG